MDDGSYLVEEKIKQRKLALDIDDTLWDHASPYFDYCKNVLGYGKGREDMHLGYNNLIEHYGWPKPLHDYSFIGLIARMDKFPILPFPGVNETLKTLKSKNVKLISVTSRGEKLFKKITEK